jgi:hypothetical protein
MCLFRAKLQIHCMNFEDTYSTPLKVGNKERGVRHEHYRNVTLRDSTFEGES